MIRKEMVKGNFVYELNKDLQDDEIICPHCQGTGLEIADNIYAISNDTVNIGVRFPYKNQSFQFCKYCYNGVLKKCKYCGSILTKTHFKCACQEAQQEERNKLELAHKALYDQATHITWEEANRIYKCFYCENIDYFFYDMVDLIDRLTYIYKEDFIQDSNTISNLRCYICEETKASIPDAYDIIERALEDGDCYETEPEDNDINDLQKVLNDFFNNRNIGITYVPNYGKGIKFKMEDFEQWLKQ